MKQIKRKEKNVGFVIQQMRHCLYRNINTASRTVRKTKNAFSILFSK